MIDFLIRFSLFSISTYGFIFFLEQKFDYPQKLSMIATFCSNILVLYFSSLLGFMHQMALIMFSIGLCFFLIYSISNYSFIKKRLFTLDYSKIWIIFYFILFSITLLNSKFIHYDNFSHWAIIVKYLLTENMLPVATSSIIDFSSYPIGSSLFIYYVSVIIGYHEGVMLLAQFAFIISALYSLFGIVKDSHRTLPIGVLFIMMAIFNHFNIAIRMNNLLVDFLLPLIALSTITGIYLLRKRLWMCSIHTILFLSVLSIIKNSGLFFVAIVLLYYLYTIIKNYRLNWNMFFCIILTPFLSFSTYLIWNNHVKNTFGDAISKHSLNVNSYQSLYAEKTPDIIQKIIDNYLGSILDITNLSTQGVILVNIFLLLSYLIIKFYFKKNNHLLRTLWLLDISVLLYYMGILAMFIFSMPTDEALVLAGFERYASSIVIFILGIATIIFVQEIDGLFFEQDILLRNYKSFKSIKSKKKYQQSSMLLLFFSIGLLLSENNGILFNNKQYSEAIPSLVRNIVGNNMQLNHKRYLLVTADKENVDNYYAKYVGRYYLYSSEVDAQENFIMSDEDFLQLISEYDYIVVLDDHFTFKALTKKLFGMELNQEIHTSEELLASLK